MAISWFLCTYVPNEELTTLQAHPEVDVLVCVSEAMFLSRAKYASE